MLRIVLILVVVGFFSIAGVYVVQSFRDTGGLVKSARDIVPTIFEADPEPPILEPFDKEVLILVTENGFTPSEVRVEIYTEVIFQNETGETVRVESITEDQRREKVFMILQPEEQKTFEPYFSGEYPFVDSLHPARTGKIIVE